ncbi:toll/interleukin-1 receptor domain-containing protein [Enterovirga rhinocerotis]|uniref:TIR domain-containing protein n=1 Tax=Enterovirga rhinocerotis TaxID=1339210 RepID=A0A4R7BIJ9_9HYPH|nr:toll/interleukin-1 receptor domain-containing protein [Enterovirga rhinocerotis]TDR85144.1 TIR domain-containing protein [Enterovirga rhinocerotis]
MTDVFISYKKEDAGRVMRLVEALRAEGFVVWWDHGIAAGSEWDRSIHQELYAAKVVVAVWSKASVGAPWVKEEALVGKNRGILVPVKIDEVEPPLGFMMIQAANLVDWQGDRSDPRWLGFLNAVGAVSRNEPVPRMDAPQRRPDPPAAPPATGPKRGLAIASTLFGALLIGLAAMWGPTLIGQRTATSQPSSPGPAAPAPAQPAPPAAPPPISPSEQALWDKAMAEKTRSAFQSYLLAYPNGAYVQRVRDILLTCRTETSEVWKEGPAVANQMLRGVGDTSGGMTPIQACDKAKNDVRAMAKNLCHTIVHNGGFRNPRWTVQDKDCDCESPNSRVTICKADLPYSCLWDMKYTERLEICG